MSPLLHIERLGDRLDAVSSLVRRAAAAIPAAARPSPAACSPCGADSARRAARCRGAADGRLRQRPGLAVDPARWSTLLIASRQPFCARTRPPPRPQASSMANNSWFRARRAGEIEPFGATGCGKTPQLLQHVQRCVSAASSLMAHHPAQPPVTQSPKFGAPAVTPHPR